MSRAYTCPICDTHLTPTQRYCLGCGERVLPLPAAIAGTLSRMAQEHAPPPPGLQPPPAISKPPTPTLFGVRMEMPSPGSLAASVLCLLAFGTVLGTTNLTQADSPLNILVNRATGKYQILPSSSAPVGGGSFGSTGSGGSVVASTPSSAAPAPASSGGSGSSGSSGSSNSSSGNGSGGGSNNGLPPIKHVWVIVLGDQGYQQTFAPGSHDRYLSVTLAHKGETVPYFYAVTQGDLANEIAMISGQGPTPQTAAGCRSYTPIRPGKVGRHHQVLGSGCVYPAGTATLATELTAAHLTWRAYIQGLGKRVQHLPPKGSQGTAAAASAHPSAATAASCRHPALGTSDHFFTAASDDYAGWRNPFVYFRGITGTQACASDDVGLSKLPGDLDNASKTPNVSFIVADPCDDGSAVPCRRHSAAGLGPANAFLRSVVPKITASKAYRTDGMILITFAQAPQTGPNPDQSSCCGQPAQFPNLPPTTNTGTTTTGTGTGTTTTGTGTGTTTTGTGTGTTTTGTGTGTTTTGTGTGTTTTGTGTGTTTTGTGTGTTTTGTTTTPTTSTGLANPTGGGGQVGLLALSRYVIKNYSDGEDYFSDFSLVGSLEQLFGLHRTGYAAGSAVPLLSGFFYSHYTPGG